MHKSSSPSSSMDHTPLSKTIRLHVRGGGELEELYKISKSFIKINDFHWENRNEQLSSNYTHK